MKTKNMKLTHILLAFAIALSLLLGCLSGCAKTESPSTPEVSSAVASISAPEKTAASSASAEDSEEAVSIPEETTAVAEARILTRQELDSDTAALLDGEDRAFEREVAYRFYHNGEARDKLTDTERNKWLAGCYFGSEWAFDDDGNGVFVVGLDAAMSQEEYYIETTSDYGESWTAAGVFNIVGVFTDVRVAGSRVVFSVSSSVTDSRYSLVYSDDLCQTLYQRDTIDFAPDSLTAALQIEENRDNLGMSILSLDKNDGSAVLGWYLEKRVGLYEFEDISDGMNSSMDYFLIGKTDATLTRCEVLYAAKEK